MQRDSGGNYYLELSGDSHFDIGHQHGQLMKACIAEALVRFKQWLEARMESSAESVIEQLVTESGFLASWQQYAPHLLEEMRGIAEGAEQPFHHIFAFNLMEEVLDCVINKKYAPAHCTTFAVLGREGQPNLLAENMDWATYYDGAQTVFRIRYPDSDLEVLMYGIAGAVSGIGVNSRGLGVAVNTVINASKRSSAEGGITCVATQRLILEQADLDSAVNCLKSMSHSYGMNYMIASAQGGMTVEVSRNDVVVIDSVADKSYVAHTNHAIKSCDLMSENPFFNGRDASTTPSVAHTVERLSCVMSELESDYEAFSVESSAALLSQVPVKVELDEDLEFQTLQSMVIEFGDHVFMHALNPNKSDQYQVYDMERVG